MYFSFLFSTIHTCDSCLIQQYSIRPVVFGGGALVISAGLRSYMWVQRSSQWEQTDSWSHCNSNLVRDFQKCCVHSDVQIAALRRLCVQNFNASPKRGIKGPPWWCHSPCQEAGPQRRRGATLDRTDCPLPPSWARAPHLFTLTLCDPAGRFPVEPKVGTDKRVEVRIIYDVKCVYGSSNVAYVVFLLARVELPLVFSYGQCRESAAAHLAVFFGLLYLSGLCPVHTHTSVCGHVTHVACCVM